MTNNEFKDLHVDYYTSSSSSYVKEIINMVPGVSETEKMFIKDIYNSLLNYMSDAKKKEIDYLSTMFIDNIDRVSSNEVLKHAEFIYNTFLKRIISDSVNREKLFDIMNETVKVLVGYYSEYQVINVNNEGVDVVTNSCFR